MPSKKRRPDAARLLLRSADSERRPPSATSGRVNRSESSGKSSVTPNSARSAIAIVAAVLIGLHRPAAADRRQRRDHREGQAHAEQHRQAAVKEGLVGAGEDERQHRQDAGAGDGQHPADIGQNKQSMRLSASGGRRLEGQRHAVHAIAQARRLWSVIEDVAKMPVASMAAHGRAAHAQRLVRVAVHGILQRRPEARPAGAAVELRRG